MYGGNGQSTHFGVCVLRNNLKYLLFVFVTRMLELFQIFTYKKIKSFKYFKFILMMTGKRKSRSTSSRAIFLIDSFYIIVTSKNDYDKPFLNQVFF